VNKLRTRWEEFFFFAKSFEVGFLAGLHDKHTVQCAIRVPRLELRSTTGNLGH